MQYDTGVHYTDLGFEIKGFLERPAGELWGKGFGR